MMKEDGMSKTIEIEGVSRTVDEWRGVLAWVEDPTSCPVPEHVSWGPSRRTAVHWRATWLVLTPELVEQIRDAVEPWQEVRREEVQPGEVYRVDDESCVAGRVTPCVSEHRWFRDWLPAKVRALDVRGDATVLVRRPLKPALTLGKVEPGTRVRASSGEGAIRGQSVSEDYVEVWLVKRHTGDRWCASTPVEIVEDDS